MITRLLSFLSLPFFCLATAQAQVAPLDRVPIRYAPPTLVVEARVNDSKPLPFAFDTGSTTCLIDAKVARQLGLKPAVGPARRGAGYARARSLAVGKADAYDLELVIRDLSALSRRTGVELAGIIGFTWMEQFVFEIDYSSGQLTLWPRSAELAPRADQLAIPLELYSLPSFTGATFYVPALLEGTRRCPMEIDTGTDIGVLGRFIARQLGADLDTPARPGRRTHSVSRLDLGGRAFTNVSFLVDARRGADGNPYAQCLIGNDQLKEFALTVDIGRRRVFFRPVPPQP